MQLDTGSTVIEEPRAVPQLYRYNDSTFAHLILSSIAASESQASVDDALVLCPLSLLLCYDTFD